MSKVNSKNVNHVVVPLTQPPLRTMIRFFYSTSYTLIQLQMTLLENVLNLVLKSKNPLREIVGKI